MSLLTRPTHGSHLTHPSNLDDPDALGDSNLQSRFPLPDAWTQAFEEAKSTLQHDLRSRNAFDQFVTESINYGLGLTPVQPQFSAPQLMEVSQLDDLKKATEDLANSARWMSQSGLYSDKKLQETANGLHDQWRSLLGSLGGGADKGSVEQRASVRGRGEANASTYAISSPAEDDQNSWSWSSSDSDNEENDDSDRRTPSVEGSPFVQAARETASVLGGITSVCEAATDLADVLAGRRPVSYTTWTTSEYALYRPWRQVRRTAVQRHIQPSSSFLTGPAPRVHRSSYRVSRRI